MSKVFQYIAYVTIALAIAMMILFTYWMLYPYNPVDFKDEVYPILNEGKIATQGGSLKYRVNYCKYVKQVPEVSKKYVDGIIYDTPGSRGVVFQGCRVQVVDNIVPDTLLPGEYYIDIEIDYQMNPLRHVIYNNRTEKFTVLAKE